MSQPARKHDDTKWNMFSMTGRALGKDPKHPNSLNHWVISDDTSLQLLPIDYALPTNVRKGRDNHYFLIDNDDLLGVKKIESELPGFTWEKCADFCKTLEKFTTMLRKYGGVQKKFYLRVISANLMGREQPGNSRVFVDELTMLIPLLRERQGMPLDNSEDDQHEIFLKYNKLSQFSSTITLNELKTLLQEYDIDKSLLTLVNDPTHILGFKSLVETGVPFKILNAYGTPIMNREQATLYMFQHLVYGMNWRDVPHRARIYIAEVIHACCLSQSGGYVRFQDVVEHVVHVKTTYFNIYKTRKSTVNMTYPGKCLDDLVAFDEYKTIAETSDLPLFMFINMELSALPIWMLKTLLTLGCLHSFAHNIRLNKVVTEMAKLTVNALMATVPGVDRQFIKDVQKETVNFMLKPIALGVKQSYALNVYAQQNDELSILITKEEQTKDKDPVDDEMNKVVSTTKKESPQISVYCHLQ